MSPLYQAGTRPLVGFGFQTDALSPIWKSATTFQFVPIVWMTMFYCMVPDQAGFGRELSRTGGAERRGCHGSTSTQKGTKISRRSICTCPQMT